VSRIQIRLTDEQYRELREMARRRGFSISALVREGVERLIAAERENKQQARQRALKFIGCLRGGPHDVSERHDDYLAEALEEELRKNAP
jgi:Arc/MetJ-type ribon-helix-helix transcriptional regulator